MPSSREEYQMTFVIGAQRVVNSTLPMKNDDDKSKSTLEKSECHDRQVPP